MKFTSKLIKKAWEIRRNAAAKFGVKVSEISWKECLLMAAEQKAEPQKIEFRANEIAAGKFAYGPKYEQGAGILSEDGEVLEIRDVVYPRKSFSGKMIQLPAHSERGHLGFESAGYGNCSDSIWGGNIPDSVKVVKGHTYPFRNLLKGRGFKWDGTRKVWCR